jgi:hypothetical protein
MVGMADQRKVEVLNAPSSHSEVQTIGITQECGGYVNNPGYPCQCSQTHLHCHPQSGAPQLKNGSLNRHTTVMKMIKAEVSCEVKSHALRWRCSELVAHEQSPWNLVDKFVCTTSEISTGPYGVTSRWICAEVGESILILTTSSIHVCSIQRTITLCNSS